MKIVNLFFLSFLLGFTLKGYLPEEEKDIIWLYIEDASKKTYYYMEVSSEGRVLLKEMSGKKAVREGYIKKVYVKDFFRETKNSDILKYSKKLDISKMLFFKGELIKISANISGEIRRVVAPITSFSQTFIYAFRQVYNEAIKLNETRDYVSFIYAIPLEGDVYLAYIKRVPPNYTLPVIETSELKKNPYIFKCVSYPWRLIGIRSKKDEADIVDYMVYKKLYGVKSAFYIGTTRGNFQLSIIE